MFDFDFSQFPRLQRIVERLRYIKKAIATGGVGAMTTGGLQPIDFGFPPFWNIVANAVLGALVFGYTAYKPTNGPEPV